MNRLLWFGLFSEEGQELMKLLSLFLAVSTDEAMARKVLEEMTDTTNPESPTLKAWEVEYTRAVEELKGRWALKDGVYAQRNDGVSVGGGRIKNPMDAVPYFEVVFPHINGGPSPMRTIKAGTVEAACMEVDRVWPMAPWWTEIRAAGRVAE